MCSNLFSDANCLFFFDYNDYYFGPILGRGLYGNRGCGNEINYTIIT